MSPAISAVDDFVEELEGLIDLAVASGLGVKDVDLRAECVSLDELPWFVVDLVDSRHVVVVDSLANF